MKLVPLLFALILLTIGCTNQQTSKIQAGSICTVESEGGKFGIIKVLVINDEEAHIKVYKNKYTERPSSVDVKTLSMGSINDQDGFGIGHIPLDIKGFDDSNPQVIGFQTVIALELQGYEMWKNQ